MNGEGERRTADGEVYKGNWVNGQLDGFGTIMNKLGTYEGEIVNSVENGKGTMVFTESL